MTAKQEGAVFQLRFVFVNGPLGRRMRDVAKNEISPWIAGILMHEWKCFVASSRRGFFAEFEHRTQPVTSKIESSTQLRRSQHSSDFLCMPNLTN